MKDHEHTMLLQLIAAPAPVDTARRTERCLRSRALRSFALGMLSVLLYLTGLTGAWAFDATTNGEVRGIVVQPDGRILVHGAFSSVGGVPHMRLARLDADGSVDASYAYEHVGNGLISALAVQGDGKALASTGGTGALRRMLPDGTPDTSFSYTAPSGGVLQVQAIVPLAGGGILVGGGFYDSSQGDGGHYVPYLVRLQADGSLDAAFDASALAAGASGGDIINHLVVQPDGRIVVTGQDGLLARVNADGSPDGGALLPTLQGVGSVSALAVQTDGKILIGSYHAPLVLDGVPRGYLVRLNADGSVDAGFAVQVAGDWGGISEIVLQPDGSIVLGGVFMTVGGQTRICLARILSDGTVDAGFGFSDPSFSEIDGEIKAVAVQPDGRVLAGGDFSIFAGQPRNNIGRLHRGGQLDAGQPALTVTPSVSGAGAVVPSVPQAALAGDILSFAAEPAPGHVLAAIEGCGGTLDGSTFVTAPVSADCTVAVQFASLPGAGFSPVANGGVYDVATFADGKVLVSGQFTSIDGVPRNGYARLNPDGSVDGAFHDASSSPSTWAIAVQPDGKALIGGKGVRGIGGLLRINPDGSVDSGFVDAVIGGQARIEAIALQPDGKILIGGWFAEIGGQTRRNLARLNADGSVDASFDPGAAFSSSSMVVAIVVQEDGRIVAGGSEGIPGYAGLVRLMPDGTLDTAAPLPALAAGAVLNAIALQPDGKLLVGGTYGFSLSDDIDRGPLIRLDVDGTVDAGFRPDGQSGEVGTIRVDAAGRILVSGSISVDGNYWHLARMNADGGADAGWRRIVLNSTGGVVYPVAEQSDGKLVVGGVFNQVNGLARGSIARLHADGRLDNGAAGALLVTPDTGSHGSSDPAGPQAVQEGAFASFRIVADPGYALSSLSGCGAVTRDGDVFTTRWIYADCTLTAQFVAEHSAVFDPQANGAVEDVAIAADGHVLVAGWFTRIGGREKLKVARLDPFNGDADPDFADGTGVYQDTVGGSVGYVVAEQADGKVLFGGEEGLMRIDSDGSLDATFVPALGPDASVTSIAVQADGKILLGGYQFGTARAGFVRLNSNGSVDSGFAPAFEQVTDMVLEPDGRIMVIGTAPGLGSGIVMARLAADGSLDTGFPPRIGSNGDGTHIDVIHRLADGRYLAGGDLGMVDLGDGSAADSYVVRILPNGTRDPTFAGLGGYRGTRSISVQADGRALIGRFANVGGQTRWRLARLGTNGVVEAGFDPLIDGSIRSTKVQSDGKILVAGNFSHVGGLARRGIARLNADGSLDATTFTVTPQAGANGTISPNLPMTAAAGEQLQFTVQPDPGYVIGNIQGCEGVLQGLVFTTAPVLGDCSVTVEFLAESVTYSVTPVAGAHGRLEPSVAQAVLFAQTTSFQVIPDEGWYLAGVEGCGGSMAGDVYSTGSILADCTVTARFHSAESVEVSAGTPQSTATGTAFAVPLAVRVVDADGQPVVGVEVVYGAPASGAGATLSATQVPTGEDGIARVTARANGTAGAYWVTASAHGSQVAFALTNESPGQGGIALRVTASTEPPPACGTQTEIVVSPGEPVNYCFTVTNDSQVTLNHHTLTMLTYDPFRFDYYGWDRLFNLLEHPLLPGETYQYNHVIAAAPTDQAPRFTWNATSALPGYEKGSDGAVGFTDISATGTPLNLTTRGVYMLDALPFGFDFYGQHFAEGSSSVLCINNSGTLSLHVADDPERCPTGNISIPPLVGDNLPMEGAAYSTYPYYAYNGIAAYWDLLGANGAVYYATLGEAPNRRLIVQWQGKDHADYPNPAGGVSFQVVIEEGSNRIHSVYDDLTFDVLAEPSPDFGGSATVGLVGFTHTPTPPYLEHSHDSPVLTDGQVITWTPTDVVRHASADVLIETRTPRLVLSPTAIAAAAVVGGEANRTLAIGNEGEDDLQWSLTEAAPRAHFPGFDLSGWLQAFAEQSARSPARSAPAAGERHLPTALEAAFAVPAYASTKSHWSGNDLGAITFDVAHPVEVTRGTGIPWYDGDYLVADLAGGDLTRAYMLGGYVGGGSSDFAFSRVDTVTDLEPTFIGDAYPEGWNQAPFHRWDSMAWDGTTDTLYAATATVSDSYGNLCTTALQQNEGMASDLYRIDPETAQTTRIGRIDTGSTTCLRALAVAPDGSMFGIDDWTNSLVAIDKATGQAAIVGWLGFPIDGSISADFDDVTGVLFLADGSDIYTVDTVTGMASLVSSMPVVGDAPVKVDGLSIATVGGECADPAEVPWLSIDSSQGVTVPGGSESVGVRLDAAGLAPGAYEAKLCVFSNDRAHALMRIPVSLTVSAEPDDRIFAYGFE